MMCVTPSFHDDAMSAELVRQEAGWFVWFVLPSARLHDFFTKEEVAHDIGTRALTNESNVIRYIESQLKAAGYQGVSRRPSLVGGADIAAAWDFAPPS